MLWCLWESVIFYPTTGSILKKKWLNLKTVLKNHVKCSVFRMPRSDLKKIKETRGPTSVTVRHSVSHRWSIIVPVYGTSNTTQRGRSADLLSVRVYLFSVPLQQAPAAPAARSIDDFSLDDSARTCQQRSLKMINTQSVEKFRRERVKYISSTC
jgi:hypothetical protein